MNGIRGRDAILRSNSRVLVGGRQIKGQYLDERALERIANLPGSRRITGFIWSYQNFCNCKYTGAKPVLPFLHFRENVFHSLGKGGMTLQPINERHRVPIN